MAHPRHLVGLIRRPSRITAGSHALHWSRTPSRLISFDEATVTPTKARTFVDPELRLPWCPDFH